MRSAVIVMGLVGISTIRFEPGLGLVQGRYSSLGSLRLWSCWCCGVGLIDGMFYGMFYGGVFCLCLYRLVGGYIDHAQLVLSFALSFALLCFALFCYIVDTRSKILSLLEIPSFPMELISGGVGCCLVLGGFSIVVVYLYYGMK